MLITDLFPSSFLKAADLGGQIREVTIESLTQEQLSDGQSKPVLKFVGIPKGLILNRTNAVSLAAALGPETDAWTGKRIRLFATPVQFQGRFVDAIRVSVGTNGAQQTSSVFD